ncbi:serine/threonine-protein kinase [Hyphomonas pacifica]|uniref:serine/threonine-protein kinase n=1 Tax=Hyphomonas pacifica TaxID=1280941 RepID=UPI000DBF9C7D|nr:serine/threonine-protein kinase [Hyphomonas pacifica]RAN36236.1 hypothetical protein HY11_12485 [Hyphomonas pacifica]
MSTESLERAALELLSRALDVVSAERAEWVRQQAGDNHALADRVLAMLAAEGAGSGRFRTGGAGGDIVEPAAPKRVGAYQITSVIGQGGMGAVYKGVRISGNFDHTVAIKIIRPGVLSDALIDRFLRERQTLAALNHPNIARLYDGGEMEDGAPYIVMEYVDGQTILDWVAEESTPLSERLRMFLDLCHAVHYAHQNLVIHRDITPSNVLVTQDGQVKLIDFGISRPQEDRAEHVLAAGGSAKPSLSYTPGYAAPERSQGASANTLSDIYSLGKLLQDLIGPESQTADLQAIIAMATATAPEDRYASVDALIEDIQNYLSGRAVNAHGAGGLYRFGKFVGRHSISVAAGVVVFLGLSAALAATYVQYTRAEKALGVANTRFAEARELSQSLVYDVYDSISRVSGTMEPRQALANVVRDYVNDLSVDEDAPDDVMFEVGIIKSRLSDLYGGVGMANLGDTDTSYALLKDAESTLEALLQRDPQDTATMAELVMVLRSVTMQNLNYRHDIEAAEVANRKALALAQRGVAIGDANERTLLRHVWSCRTDALQIMLSKGESEAALESVRQWRKELTPEMFAQLGGGEEMAAYLAIQEAEFLTQLQRGEEAVEPLQYAISFREQALKDSPKNYYQMTQLMVALGEMSTALRQTPGKAESLEYADKAVALARQIQEADPQDAGGPEGLSSMLMKKADTLVTLQDYQAAKAALEEATALSISLVQQFPDDLFYESLLFMALDHSVETDLAMNGWETLWSCELLKKAAQTVPIREKLSDPDSAHDLDELSTLTDQACLP